MYGNNLQKYAEQESGVSCGRLDLVSSIRVEIQRLEEKLERKKELLALFETEPKLLRALELIQG